MPDSITKNTVAVERNSLLASEKSVPMYTKYVAKLH